MSGCRQGVPFSLVLAASVVLALAGGLTSAPKAQESKEGDKKEEKKELVVGKWYPGVEAGLTFAQSSYSDNWAGGDKGSVVWTGILNSSLQSQMSTRVNWRNTCKLAFGQTHQQRADSTGARSWETPQKTTDLVDFESLLRLTLGGFVDPFAGFAFQSQFQDASDLGGRTLALNPMQFKESAGVARKFLETEDRALLSRLGFAFRQNLRRSFTEPAPSAATKSDMTNDGGLEWVTDYKTKIMGNRIAWTSKLTAYQPVFYSGKSDLEDLSAAYLDSVGVDRDVARLSTRVSADWENIWTSQITKILSVSLYTRWIYDPYDNSVKPLPAPGGGLENPGAVRAAVRKAGQFKETLSLGLTVRFV